MAAPSTNVAYVPCRGLQGGMGFFCSAPFGFNSEIPEIVAQVWSQQEWERFIGRANSLVKRKLDFAYRERISISTLPTLMIVAGFLPASYGWEKGLWWSAYLTLAIGLLLPCVSCTMAGFLQARNRARLDSVLSRLMNLCDDHSTQQATGLRWAARFREVSMQRTNIWLEATLNTPPQ